MADRLRRHAVGRPDLLAPRAAVAVAIDPDGGLPRDLVAVAQDLGELGRGLRRVRPAGRDRAFRRRCCARHRRRLHRRVRSGAVTCVRRALRVVRTCASRRLPPRRDGQHAPYPDAVLHCLLLVTWSMLLGGHQPDAPAADRPAPPARPPPPSACAACGTMSQAVSPGAPPPAPPSGPSLPLSSVGQARPRVGRVTNSMSRPARWAWPDCSARAAPIGRSGFDRRGCRLQPAVHPSAMP